MKTVGKSRILPRFVDAAIDQFMGQYLRAVYIRTDFTVARCWVAEEFQNSLAV
jgi:hypothetical protein